MIIAKAKDDTEQTAVMVQLKGTGESIMNEYYALIKGIAKGILNEVDNEEERKEVRSELVKFLAECAAII